MANLFEVCELAYNNVFPIPRDKTAITLAEFIASGRVEYAAAMWLYRQEQIQTDGSFQMPSELLTNTELAVENNELDLSGLKYLSALPNDLWLQNLGGINCECQYVKTNLNLAQILCDDDSAGDNVHYYYIEGKKIKFLKPPHKTKLPITYANMGTSVDERRIEVNEYVASKVRTKLEQLYGKRAQNVDTTNNNQPST